MAQERRSLLDIRAQTCRGAADEGIARLAASQYGVIARWQLDSLGVTRSMVEARVARGTLLRLHRGVYAVGHRQLRREGHRLAAVLAVGPGAVLSHRDAAALHGLRAANHVATDVTTTQRGRASRPGIAVHHTTVLDPVDVAVVDGVPVTSVARTLVDLAGLVPRIQLARAMSEAERLRTFDLAAIEAALARVRGRGGPGHANLRAELTELRQRGVQLTRSALEDAFLRLVASAGLAHPRMNLHVEGVEVDAVWPDERLAVELDGYAHHRHRSAFQRDREKGNVLAEAGWTLLRFTHDDVVRRPGETAARLHRMLRQRTAA